MTVNDLINRARKEGERRLVEEYKEICDGIDGCDYRLEIQKDKKTGEYQDDLQREIAYCMYDVMNVIRKTERLTKEQKNTVCSVIKQTKEVKMLEKSALETLGNYFTRWNDSYKK